MLCTLVSNEYLGPRYRGSVAGFLDDGRSREGFCLLPLLVVFSLCVWWVLGELMFAFSLLVLSLLQLLPLPPTKPICRHLP
jgi:hypothetical protein